MTGDAWGVIRLYHGTRAEWVPSLETGVDPGCGRPVADFGRGFYMTSNVAQARIWAQRLADDAGSDAKPAVVAAWVSLEALARLYVVAFVLPSETSGFAPLVRRFRGTNEAEAERRADRRNVAIDLTIGPVVKNLKRGTTHSGYDQYVFHTQDAVKVLEERGKLNRID